MPLKKTVAELTAEVAALISAWDRDFESPAEVAAQVLSLLGLGEAADSPETRAFDTSDLHS